MLSWLYHWIYVKSRSFLPLDLIAYKSMFNFQFFMNLVAPHLNVTERVPAIGQLDDDEQFSTDTISQLNHFDPSILKTTFKIPKSKRNLQSKNTWTYLGMLNQA